MIIVRIESASNGSHSFQKISGRPIPVPDGWALVPDGMETPHFPFGTVEAETIGGVTTVTKWTPSELPPEPEPEPPEPPEPSEEDDINAMLIDHELRIMDLELGISEEEV